MGRIGQAFGGVAGAIGGTAGCAAKTAGPLGALLLLQPKANCSLYSAGGCLEIACQIRDVATAHLTTLRLRAQAALPLVWQGACGCCGRTTKSTHSTPHCRQQRSRCASPLSTWRQTSWQPSPYLVFCCFKKAVMVSVAGPADGKAGPCARPPGEGGHSLRSYSLLCLCLAKYDQVQHTHI